MTGLSDSLPMMIPTSAVPAMVTSCGAWFGYPTPSRRTAGRRGHRPPERPPKRTPIEAVRPPSRSSARSPSARRLRPPGRRVSPSRRRDGARSRGAPLVGISGTCSAFTLAEQQLALLGGQRGPGLIADVVHSHEELAHHRDHQVAAALTTEERQLL